MKSALVATLTLATAVAAQAAPFTGKVLGVDNASIYSIDLATGLGTSLASLSGHGTGDVNGLAYDGLTNTAYFQRNGDLWSVALGTGTFAKTGVTVGGIADATFYNGAYVFATGSDLRSVNLGTKATSVLGTYNKSWGFGDIATTGSMLYGSSGSSFFSINMGSSKAYTSISTSGKQLQLGFVGSSLYGIATGNSGNEPAGKLYAIDLTTGTLTASANRAHDASNAFLQIRDAATYQPVPEPASLAALGLGVLGLARRRRR